MLSSSFILSKPFFNGLFDEEVNTSLTAAVTCLFMLALALSGSYSNAEKIGLTVGSLQVVFFILMFAARPSLSEILEDSVQFPITDGEFGNLVTANIGAVIMSAALRPQPPDQQLCFPPLGTTSPPPCDLALISLSKTGRG